jgi:hypothetical protein
MACAVVCAKHKMGRAPKSPRYLRWPTTGNHHLFAARPACAEGRASRQESDLCFTATRLRSALELDLNGVPPFQAGVKSDRALVQCNTPGGCDVHHTRLFACKEICGGGSLQKIEREGCSSCPRVRLSYESAFIESAFHTSQPFMRVSLSCESALHTKTAFFHTRTGLKF